MNVILLLNDLRYQLLESQAAPDVRIGGGQRRQVPNMEQISELGGSGGMPPGKIFF